MVALIFEGDFQLGPVSLDFAVSDNEVLLNDFGNSKLAQCFYCALDRVSGRLFLRCGAGSDQFDDLIDALRHVSPPSHYFRLSLVPPGSSSGSPEDGGSLGRFGELG